MIGTVQDYIGSMHTPRVSPIHQQGYEYQATQRYSNEAVNVCDSPSHSYLTPKPRLRHDPLLDDQMPSLSTNFLSQSSAKQCHDQHQMLPVICQQQDNLIFGENHIGVNEEKDAMVVGLDNSNEIRRRYVPESHLDTASGAWNSTIAAPNEVHSPFANTSADVQRPTASALVGQVPISDEQRWSMSLVPNSEMNRPGVAYCVSDNRNASISGMNGFSIHPEAATTQSYFDECIPPETLYDALTFASHDNGQKSNSDINHHMDSVGIYPPDDHHIFKYIDNVVSPFCDAAAPCDSSQYQSALANAKTYEYDVHGGHSSPPSTGRDSCTDKLELTDGRHHLASDALTHDWRDTYTMITEDLQLGEFMDLSPRQVVYTSSMPANLSPSSSSLDEMPSNGSLPLCGVPEQRRVANATGGVSQGIADMGSGPPNRDPINRLNDVNAPVGEGSCWFAVCFGQLLSTNSF